jgi:hypothetical protein
MVGLLSRLSDQGWSNRSDGEPTIADIARWVADPYAVLVPGDGLFLNTGARAPRRKRRR